VPRANDRLPLASLATVISADYVCDAVQGLNIKMCQINIIIVQARSSINISRSYINTPSPNGDLGHAAYLAATMLAVGCGAFGGTARRSRAQVVTVAGLAVDDGNEAACAGAKSILHRSVGDASG